MANEPSNPMIAVAKEYIFDLAEIQPNKYLGTCPKCHLKHFTIDVLAKVYQYEKCLVFGQGTAGLVMHLPILFKG